MMKRKLAGVLVAVGALHSSVSLALGLGNLTVHSSLNQPLVADIRLLDVGDLNPDQIRVSLASTKEFERAGIERVFFLTNLHFDVISNNGKYVIKVTTDSLVHEPYLDFLLQLSWPSGRLLRDYTVLVDLPDTAAAPQSSRPRAATVARAATKTRQAVPQSQQPSSAPVAAGTAGEPVADHVRVARNNTLWGLSERVRRGDATVQQTMLALQQANPQAFLRSNINGLQAGRVLRVPSEEEIHAVSRQQAVREVARQNDDWVHGIADSGKRQLEGSHQNATHAKPATGSSGYLRLASGSSSSGGASGDKKAAGAAALNGQLIATQENLDSAKRENSELNSRVSDLQEQIGSLEKLVELKDNQLATLQAQVANNTETGQSSSVVAVTGDEKASAASVALSAVAPVSGDGGTSDETAPGVVATAAKGKGIDTAVKKPAVNSPPQVAIKPPREPGLVDRLTSNPLYSGLAAALVALLGLGVWYSRRNRTDEPLDDTDFLDTFDSEVTADSDITEAPATAAVHGVAAAVDGDDESGEVEPAVADIDQPMPTTDDVVSEAEVYRSYGRDDESRALLQSALVSDPDQADVRLKLMEYQVADGDRDSFREHYRVLMERCDQTSLAAAAALLAGDAVAGNWADGLAEPATGEQPSAASAGDETYGIETVDEVLDADFDLDMPADDLDTTHSHGALDLDPDFEAALDDELDSREPEHSVEAGMDFAVSSESLATEPAEHDVLESGLGSSGEPRTLSTDEVASDYSTEVEQSSADQADDSIMDVAAIDSNLDASDAAEADSDGSSVEAVGANESAVVEASDPLGTDADAMEFDLDLEFDSTEPGPTGAPANVTSAADIEVDTDAAMRDLDAMLEAGGDDEEFEILGDADEVATKLDLARAYIDMGDVDGAREILDEVLDEGSDDQKQEANSLLANMTG